MFYVLTAKDVPLNVFDVFADPIHLLEKVGIPTAIQVQFLDTQWIRITEKGGWVLRGVAVMTETAIMAWPSKPPKPSKPPRLPHCAVFCRTSKRRVRCSSEPPKPSKPPKPSWRLPPLNSTPLFRDPEWITWNLCNEPKINSPRF